MNVTTKKYFKSNIGKFSNYLEAVYKLKKIV
jgi:hypothetical protein